jgi:hypothetical protein
MREHIKEKHSNRIKTAPIKEEKNPSGFSGWGLLVGIIIGYIFAFVLSYLLGYLIGIAIYGFVFILFIWYAQEHNDRFLKGVSIGTLGILLGFLIIWMMEWAAKRNKAYTLLIFVVSWLIVMGIAIVISIIEAGNPVTTNVGSIYNFSVTTQEALCSNNTAYIQSLFRQNGVTNYTVISTYCVGSDGYITEKHT